jgi:hypothetical protein
LGFGFVSAQADDRHHLPKPANPTTDYFFAISPFIFSMHVGQMPCEKVAAVLARTYCSTVCQ